MKLKGSYFYTLREDVKDEESTSGNLLVRSGMIKRVGSGMYMFLPMGLKVLNNLKNIVNEEMVKAGAEELLMPSLIPEEVYDVCGRTTAFGSSMFHITDRSNKKLCLGPTHEELFTIAAKSMVKSYKDLPFTIYQMADKFRDEARPRFGLVRVKEFIMKDAYSFDRDEKSLDNSYRKMFNAYQNIMDRAGINYAVVRASNGLMGGSLSEEFQAITDIGEDTLVLCDNCDYASNLEVSTFRYEDSHAKENKLELVETPNAKTIQEVAEYLGVDEKDTIKALLMEVKGELVIFFIRGDRELNTEKVASLLETSEINFASDELILSSNVVPGYTGPIDIKGANVIIDEEILHMKNFVCGANKEGYHYVNVNIRDISYDVAADISCVKEDDICPKCGGRLYFKRGIEVGNTFKLGTKYSENFGLTYLDENNQEQLVTMGCYGIGLGRMLAAIVEQNNDENGMILPVSVAPYQVSIVVTNTNDEYMMNYANKLHDELTKLGIDVLLDDRDERPGVKFKDMDLIGIPFRITIGKKFMDSLVELKQRNSDYTRDIRIADIVEVITNLIKEAK